MNITDFLLARIQEDEKRASYYGPLAMGTDRVLAECTAHTTRWLGADRPPAPKETHP